MNSVRRFIHSFKLGALALVLAVAYLGLSVATPLCAGARVATMSQHPCCAGMQTCHRQWRQSPCCEYQPAAPAIPNLSADPKAGLPSLLPVLVGTLPVAPTMPSSLRSTFDLSKRAQAPPLYLTKLSFLC